MVIVSPRLEPSEIMAVLVGAVVSANARPVGIAMDSRRARSVATLSPGLLMDI